MLVSIIKRFRFLFILFLSVLVIAGSLFFALNSSFVHGKIHSIISEKVKKYPFDIRFSIGGISLFPPSITFKIFEIIKDSSTPVTLSNCLISNPYDVYKYYAGPKIICESGVVLPLLFKKLMPENSEKNISKSAGNSAKKKFAEITIKKTEIVVEDKKITALIFLKYENGLTSASLRDWRKDKSDSFSLDVSASIEKKELTASLNQIETAYFTDMIFPEKKGMLSGKVSGKVFVKALLPELFIETSVRADSVTISHEVIDNAPIIISSPILEGAFKINKDEKSLLFEKLKIGAKGVFAYFTGKVDKTKFSLEMEESIMPLVTLASIIQDPVLKDYGVMGSLKASFKTEGVLEPERKLTEMKLNAQFVDVKVESGRLDYLENSFSHKFTDKRDVSYNFVVGPENNSFTPISTLPKFVYMAVAISEDGGFFRHPGIDFAEISAAIDDNIKNGKMRGGSTITQQLAKNLFLTRDKTFMRKVKEALLAVELDATLEKQRILEIYLNIIEWGPGLFGIGSAARHYFGKSASELAPQEAAFLATIIPNPNRFYMYFERGGITERWDGRLQFLLERMYDYDILTFEEYHDAMLSEIVFNGRTPEE